MQIQYKREVKYISVSDISREYSIFNQLTILVAYFADTHRLILALLS